MKLQLQPESCRAPLQRRELPNELAPHVARVLFFDPLPVYERMSKAGHGSIYKRVNSLSMAILFPTEEPGVCACGCGARLQGRNKRWATPSCTKFALAVYWIIAGRSSTYSYYLWIYNNYDSPCFGCGVMYADCQIDHIIPVFAGGGLCWLGNLQRLCLDCHKQKTKNDYKIYS